MVRASDDTAQRLRWETADCPPAQAELFAPQSGRIRHPEFRDLEFVHVRAKSIINEVPKVSRVPFRYTINVYRGCSHACSYCFARPTHEYLNLDAGRDFERVIVVKVNAIELLRRELARARNGGQHIAMGTNTDPYQRCEGRYELTRGIVDTLGRAGNPFSILTKSALVLRDLDLLLEAAERTDVGVSFSIGTLDTEVWRATEPGTPHPRRRVEAIAALADAGLAPGVLVAPIIPGISDSRGQLRATLAACIDAGARSVTPIVLHLRPGVKEQFLPWLADKRPDLLDRYHSLYPRSYAPKEERARIMRIVDELVAELGGPRRVRASTARKVAAPGLSGDEPEPDRPERVDQLRLL